MQVDFAVWRSKVRHPIPLKKPVAASFLLCIFVLVVYLFETKLSSPTPTFRHDLACCYEWIIKHRDSHGDLPSIDDFHLFVQEMKLVIPMEYERHGHFFTLGGWDGNHRWLYQSESGKLSLVDD